MLRIRHLFPLLLIGVAACDNVGRAFDPIIDSDNPGAQTGTSEIAIVPVGGDVRDGRPVIRAAYPKDAGWPATVPVVVEFSESVNQDWLKPTSATGTDGRIGVRVQGTTQLLPCQYDFEAGNRLLILRPLNGLPAAGGAIYEVVLLPDSRDVDGVRFSITGGEKVLTDFQTNQDSTLQDGRIVALFPRDNNAEMTREGDVWVVFDRPCNAATLIAGNVFVRTQGGAPLNAALATPLSTVGLADTRVLRINPNATLAASTRHELVVNDSITFGQSGKLSFNNRTPFARFDTVGPAVPTAIALDNPITGFPNKINRDNVANARLRVDTPADTLAGDRIRARIYGGVASTAATFDLTFVERTVTVPAAGAQTVTIDFAGQLGSIGSPKFDDGSVTFAAQMLRGSSPSGFVHQGGNDEPRFDVTPPTLDHAGPPAAADGLDLLTDQEAVAFEGVASEVVAGADLADGVNPITALWASGSDGRFTVKPVPLGRLTAPRSYTLTLTDDAGNLAAATVAGRIVQRGLVTGTLAGTLVVEAYDEATLLPIAGATVLLDAPAATQRVGTTDDAGRVSFSSAAASHTVTIVRAGYGLTTLAGTQAAFVSLPLRANAAADAAATLVATATFQPSPGKTILLSDSAFASADPLGIESSTATPNELPHEAIVPNRQQVITAFGGSFEPTAVPAYSLQGSQLLGATLTQPTVPGGPAAAGTDSAQSLLLLDASATFSGLVSPATEDFVGATGLDLGDLLTGAPRVRVTSSLSGFRGQVLVGVGAVTATAGTQYTVEATWSLPIIGGFAEFSPVSWLLTDAEDTAGRRSRTRRLLDPTAGNVTTGLGATAIPVVTAPAGPSTGAPLVEFVDVLTPVPGLGVFTVYEVTATDPNGRRWTMLVPDRDAAGGTEQVQFPAFTAAAVAGLASGTWSVVVEARAFLTLTAATIDDFVLAERIRQEVNYARSRAVSFTVQ
ncbi:MAG: hypothetical protein H6835_05975 [Planctomycetes bacterium]|nr:hypothetical protein [Planctomycetota bacterium]